MSVIGVLENYFEASDIFVGEKAVSCMENFDKFRMLANNQPLQFVVTVEQGREARLICHFWYAQQVISHDHIS